MTEEKNPFDDILSEDASASTEEKSTEPKTEPEAKPEPKKRGPRKAAQPKTEPEAKPEPKKRGPRKAAQPKTEEPKKIDFDSLDLPSALSAAAGQVVGTVSNNASAVPVLSIALQNWIGAEPVVVPASNGFDDIRKVLDDLEAQAHKL